MEKILLRPMRKQERPYCQLELEELRGKWMTRTRVGCTMVSHSNCGHFYFAKEGGKKELNAIETGGLDCGSCSVCWQLKKTPPELRQHALDLIDSYQIKFESKPTRWTLKTIKLFLAKAVMFNQVQNY